MTEIKKHQNLPTNWEERELLRNKGQFWTPTWVANAMISYVLKSKPKTILDPAIGEGAFYEAYLNQKNGEKIKFIGRDIDPEILNAPIFSNNGKDVEIEIRDFLKHPPKNSFQAIIANPPYIRHHRIDKETKEELKKICKKITGFTIDGRAGYHIYFLIQSLHFLNKDGRLAFIMPADTCEGRFADKLWEWITKNYCLECVCTFKEEATPFPAVDTNALVFFIRNNKPKDTIKWVEVSEAYTDCLQNYVKGEFKEQNCGSLKITNRNLQEALETGLSRPQTINKSKYQLSDFASVMRGIATGANDFFFLTKDQTDNLNLPTKYLKRAVGRTRDVEGDLVTAEMLKELEEKNRPTYLLSIGKEELSELPKILQEYIEKGEKQELHLKSLIQQRKPWYKMEKREIPPLLFAYLGRRNTRFIKNEANVLPLTGFLCVYPHKKEKGFINKLWKVLNHEDTIKNLRLVGKSYGSGAIKVEPSGLRKLPIPEHLVEEFELEAKNQERNGQLRMFKEPEPEIKYRKLLPQKKKMKREKTGLNKA